MKQSKEYKEFMDALHRFNQKIHTLTMTLVEILQTIFNKILEGLKETEPLDAGELELIEE